MKKRSFMFAVLLIVVPLLAGCQKQKKEEEPPTETEGILGDAAPEQTIKLVWQTASEFTGALKHRPDYFNQVLKEKNLPYEIEFISYKEGSQEQTTDRAVDIKTRAWTWMEPYDTDKEIRAGEMLALDEYLDSVEGKRVKNMLPEKVWDTYKVDGKNYYLLGTGFVPCKTAYIWDKELAEKYDVHPENWSEKIWEYKEELQKIREGEKERENFIPIRGLYDYSRNLNEMTETLGTLYPFVIDETDPDSGVSLRYETSEYQEYLLGAKALYEAGIYDPDKEEMFNDADSFLVIDPMFVTKEAYGVWEDEDFWETHEMKEIGAQHLWQLTIGANETGISAKSAHPDEAFAFLCSLYTDPELSNALMWGEEGVDYELHGDTAEKPVERGYVPPCIEGNFLIAHAQFGFQDEKKAELYPKWLEECKDSCLKGFCFSAEGCEEELQDVLAVSERWSEKGQKAFLEENEVMIQEYKEAGADQVIEEWNRQYKEYLEKKGE